MSDTLARIVESDQHGCPTGAQWTARTQRIPEPGEHFLLVGPRHPFPLGYVYDAQPIERRVLAVERTPRSPDGVDVVLTVTDPAPAPVTCATVGELREALARAERRIADLEERVVAERERRAARAAAEHPYQFYVDEVPVAAPQPFITPAGEERFVAERAMIGLYRLTDERHAGPTLVALADGHDPNALPSPKVGDYSVTFEPGESIPETLTEWLREPGGSVPWPWGPVLAATFNG